MAMLMEAYEGDLEDGDLDAVAVERGAGPFGDTVSERFHLGDDTNAPAYITSTGASPYDPNAYPDEAAAYSNREAQGMVHDAEHEDSNTGLYIGLGLGAALLLYLATRKK